MIGRTSLFLLLALSSCGNTPSCADAAAQQILADRGFDKLGQIVTLSVNDDAGNVRMMTRSRVLSRASACFWSASAAVAFAQPAHADVLTVNATGTIGASCSVAASSAFGTPNLSANGNVGAQATVNCDTGFKV